MFSSLVITDISFKNGSLSNNYTIVSLQTRKNVLAHSTLQIIHLSTQHVWVHVGGGGSVFLGERNHSTQACLQWLSRTSNKKSSRSTLRDRKNVRSPLVVTSNPESSHLLTKVVT